MRIYSGLANPSEYGYSISKDENDQKHTTDQEVDNIQDKFFRDIYGRPDNMVGFLKDFLPSSLVNSLDLNHLEVRKKSYLSEEYKEHYNDLVVKTRFKDRADEPVFVYLQQLHNFLDLEAAVEYIEIFMKYLAKTENPVTRTDAVKAIETIFPQGGMDMIKGWAKEYADEGMQQGMLTEAKEMVLEALDTKFSPNIPADVQRKINALNNRVLLKKLLSSAIQSNDIDTFRKTLEEIAPDQPEG